MCPHHHSAAEEPHCGFPGAADDKSPVWYAAKHGITISSVENINVKLRRGEGIVPKCHYNRKSCIVPFQHLVRLEVELDPTVPMRDVRNDLEVIVGLSGGTSRRLERKSSTRWSGFEENLHNRPTLGDATVGDVVDRLTEDNATAEGTLAPPSRFRLSQRSTPSSAGLSR